jgi:hypothetical protein
MGIRLPFVFSDQIKHPYGVLSGKSFMFYSSRSMQPNKTKFQKNQLGMKRIGISKKNTGLLTYFSCGFGTSCRYWKQT